MLVHVDGLFGLASGLTIEFNQLKDVDSFGFPVKLRDGHRAVLPQ